MRRNLPSSPSTPSIPGPMVTGPGRLKKQIPVSKTASDKVILPAERLVEDAETDEVEIESIRDQLRLVESVDRIVGEMELMLRQR